MIYTNDGYTESRDVCTDNVNRWLILFVREFLSTKKVHAGRNVIRIIH